MSESQSFPPIDLYAISFPSDGVTLGKARKIDRELNGVGVFSSSGRLNDARADDILAIIPLSYEMELAEKAYAKVLGLPDPSPTTTRTELVDHLRREWKQNGISSGPQQSTQFIREIETAAKRQAEAHLGKGR